MHSVIINVYNSFVINETDLTLDDAIDLCGNLIATSHGGDAWVVSNETAQEIEGENCTETVFECFDINGNPRRC